MGVTSRRLRRGADRRCHDRGLFSVTIGADGVRLAKHLERFNIIASSCATALEDIKAALTDDVPWGMSKKELFAFGHRPTACSLIGP